MPPTPAPGRRFIEWIAPLRDHITWVSDLERIGFQNGAAAAWDARQEEVERAERIVTLAYRGAECVHPHYRTEMVGLTLKSVRTNCGTCWGCELAKAAAEYRGLK